MASPTFILFSVIKGDIMKKLSFITVFLVIFSLVLPYAGSADAYVFEPSEVKISSAAAYMENLETGEVVINKKADEKRIPASLTKIMTCVVVLDNFKENLEILKTEKISAGEEAFTELYDTGYSNAGIKPDEQLTYYDLLCALMIPSACEAANILAINVGGSLEGFANLMNEKAKALKMDSTTFYNAHGLEIEGQESNITTCSDLAKLCRYAINTYPIFTEITSKSGYTMENGTYISTTNKLLDPESDYYYGYVSGIKTGYLDTAGRCLASVAEKNGYSYLCITMGADGYDDDGNELYLNCADHKALYTWAFDKLSYQTFIKENEEVTDTKVEYAQGDGYVNLKPAGEVTAIWRNDIPIEELERKITISDNIIAPIYAGEVLGSVEFLYNGKSVAKSDLVATKDVFKSKGEASVTVAANFFTSTQFKIAVVIIAVIILVYTIVFFVYVHRRSKKRVSEIKEKYRTYDDEDDYDDGYDDLDE